MRESFQDLVKGKTTAGEVVLGRVNENGRIEDFIGRVNYERRRIFSTSANRSVNRSGKQGQGSRISSDPIYCIDRLEDVLHELRG
jgi:hypothetical protein